MSLTIKQQKRLERLSQVIKDGDLAIAEYIFDLEDRLDQDMPALHDLLARLKGDKGDNYKPTQKDFERIAQMAENLVDLDKLAKLSSKKVVIPVQEIVRGVLKLIPKPENGKTPTNDQLIALIKKLIPPPVPGAPGKNADEELILDNLAKKMPTLSYPIRDALELIDEEEEKLSMDAISGLKEYIEKHIKTQVIGGQKGLQVYVGGEKKGLLQMVNFVGDGITIEHSKVNGMDTITFEGSGGGSGNLDGGTSTSVYGGTTPIDGGDSIS